jgi:hypothetical protein
VNGPIDPHNLPLHSGRPLAIVPPPVSDNVDNFKERPPQTDLQHWVRASLVMIALGLVGVFGVAIALDPYQEGKVWLAETHRQLGLPPCTFKYMTGYPCPSCGMTSSFALAIRGDFWNSLRANFVGTLLALGALVFIPWAVVSAGKARLLGISNFESVLVRSVLVFFILMFARWGVVLALAFFNKST